MPADVSLMSLIEARIASGDVELPPASEVSTRLQALTASPDFDMNEVVQLICSDQVLTAEVLRVANGAFYGGLSEVRTVADATVRLGATEITRLAVMCSEKANYKARHPALAALIPDLWNHSVGTAMGARWLADKLGFKDLQNEAFIGGLLHDVGSLLIVRVIDQILQEEGKQIELREPLLIEILERGHTSHGYTLAGMWNLPQSYCEVVRDHHLEEASQSNQLLNLVALADKACTKLGIGIESDDSLRLDATEQALTLGASDLVLAQLSVMLEDATSLAS